ncbi:D-amino-acid oxidase [Prauserella isguenensis]|uniref:D-amino-acid oxidase n=1 Tax=Prauserella isguenensis TaxID=1470180 RepID=A0A839RW79_9PSEU|nr:FAD-dependent oxidoreductase [Prauserella isguenensis]MBB3049393.1 D-amino-acid oxidase [Prauserella isguenensis]
MGERVVVVGAGVVGLSCAVRLAERGRDVTVVTDREPGDTTSVVAGGLIYPRHAEPVDRCARWTATTVEEFRRLADVPGTGVRFVPGRLLRRAERPVPEWAEAVGGMARRTDLGAPWTDALEFTTPLVDTGRYLQWLAAAAARAGVRTERRRVRDLGDVDHADLVVNAAGLGAVELAGDTSMVAARGQVVHVADPGLTEWVVDEDDFSYVLPHGDHVVCGGTEEPGRADLEPDAATTGDILLRCRELVPALADAEVLGVRVGLRPARPEIRVERVDGRTAPPVIHCYGHGGVGVTVSWGCADEVAALAC